MNEIRERLTRLVLDRLGEDRAELDFGPWREINRAWPAAVAFVTDELPRRLAALGEGAAWRTLEVFVEALPGPPDHIHVTAPLPSYAFRLPSGRRVRFEVKATGPIEVTETAGELVVGLYRPAEQNTTKRFVCETCEAIGEAKAARAWRDELHTPRVRRGKRSVSALEHHVAQFFDWHTKPLLVYDRAAPRWQSEFDRLLHEQWLPLDEQVTESRVRIVAELRELGRRLIALLTDRHQPLADAWREAPRARASYLCVTLDRVPQALYAEIVSNEAQIAAWRQWLAIDTLDGFKQPLTVEFLTAHPSLPLDTRYFDEAFNAVLLAAVGSTSDQLDGLLIRGENAAALRWLAAEGDTAVRCVYIDPPYNTGSGVWSYDDQMSREHWRVMMRDRLTAARELMSEDAAIFVTLDDHEHAPLRLLMEEVFGSENFLATIVWEKVHTRKNSARHFSVSHDYIPAFAKNKARWRRQLLPRDQTAAYGNPDHDPRGPWKLDPVYANKPYSADYQIRKPNGATLDRPAGRYWRFSQESFERKAAAGEVVWGPGDAYPMVKRYLADVQDGLVPTTLFTREFAGDNAQANAELTAMFGHSRQVSYPKPSRLVRRIVQIATSAAGRETVLDFFAGTGSTAQAVIDENRRDGGDRRFVLVEKDATFETVLVPRVMKCIFAEAWKDGRLAFTRGSSVVVRVVTLETLEERLAREIE
jgi:adenine-specific DNA-methyltransferase